MLCGLNLELVSNFGLAGDFKSGNAGSLDAHLNSSMGS
jgi:hypothetical protein